MRISITIPSGAVSLVKAGDFVEIGDKLFSAKKTTDITLNIADKLNINPETIFKYLHKLIGEKVRKNELIAQKKGFIGGKSVVAPADGAIKAIDHLLGYITVSIDETSQNDNRDTHTVRAFFSGSIEEIVSHSLTVMIKGGKQFSARAITGDGGGELFFFRDQSNYFTSTEREISGKIVFIEEIKPHIQVKCEALGCVGFVFLKGNIKTELPTMTLSRLTDYDTITNLGRKHILFTVNDNSCVVYD